MNLATVDAPTFRRKAREWFARGFVSQEAAKPEVTWTTFPEPKELRLEDTLHELRDLLLGAYVPNMQEWAPSTFHWALLKAFAGLFDVSKDEGEKFWAKPLVEIRFPFGWDASNPNVPRAVVGRGLEPRNLLPDGPLPLESMTEEDKDLRFQAMLFGALFPVAPPGYRRDVGDSYAVHVPQSVKDELERLPPEEREAEGWKRLQPFTMGAREFRPRAAYPEPPTREGPLPPPVSVRGDEVDGAPLYEAASFVELGQLVVEPGEERAYFPMLVGLAMTGAKPETWPESERSTFWPALFSALEASVRENVSNAAKVPVSPNVTTTSLEPFFRSKVDLSFASSGLLSEASGLVRLPVEEDNVDEPPLLVGIAQATAEAGETVNVAVAGDALFAAKPNAHKDEGGPTELELGMGHAGAIVNAARAFGVEVPENFVFGAGQVFYKDRKLVEVRLSGFVNARLRDNGAGAGEIEASPWTTETAPTLTADEDGVLSLAPVDAGRTHLSAMVVRTSNEPIAISLLWDLRENAPAPTPKASTSLEDVTLTATGTVSGGGSDFPRELAAERPVEKRVFPLAFGQTLVDKSTALFVSHAHKIKLPAKKWSTLPSWWDLTASETKRLLEEHGADAFKDYRSQEGRGPLLKKRTNARGEEVISLTAEAERTLKITKGLSGGFRHVDSKNGQEYFVRLFEAGSGYVEVGLSWLGLAGPWVEEWRRELRTQTAEATSSPKQLGLFSELTEEQQARINRLLSRVQLLEDGQKLMGAIIGQVGRQGRNPVEVPAIALRVLLKLETDPHWKARVEGALEALRRCEFKIESVGRRGQSYGYGSFLGPWFYSGAGDGAHGDGVYRLEVETPFLGCLRVFESQRRKLRDGREVTHYEFNRKLSKDQKKELGWQPRRESPAPEAFVHFDAGRPFYNAAAGLTSEQGNLMAFLEREITVQKSAVSRTLGNYATRSKLQAKKGPDANRPRLYTKEECPLLREGTNYHAAIGNFTRNPEAAWRLGGTPRREGADGGAHTGGLIHELGYHYPTGSAKAKRAEVVRKTLEDLKAVVEEYLAGVVAIRMKGGDWLSLEAASKLSESSLVDQASFFLFLPEGWRSEEKTRFAAVHEDRARRGEGLAAWTVTESTEEAARARLSLAGSDDLHRRLRIARKERNLSQVAVGGLFGVSQKTIALWEQGPEPDSEGAVHGKPVSKDLRPLVERWVSTGAAPTKDELESMGKGKLQPSV